MMNADISVVVPAYNEAKRLSACLQALISQETMPKEVIVVDNNSTDGTGGVAKKYIDKFARRGTKLIVVSEPTQGIAPARNRGFYLATGKIIASIDADSQVLPDWITNIERHFEQYDSMAVGGIPIMIDDNWLVRTLTEHNYYYYLSNLLKLFTGFLHISGACMAVRSTIFRQVGEFDNTQTTHNHLDDSELASRLSLVGEIRIDKSIRVYTSFRRHAQLWPAIKVNWARIKTLAIIARNRKDLIKSTRSD